MELADLLSSAADLRVLNEDGKEDLLRLRPALSEHELDELRQRAVCPLPPAIESALRVARGFDNGPLESFDFSGLSEVSVLQEIFPHALPIAHDGLGNYWIVDLAPQSTTWGPIFYVCHDPPVVVFQCSDVQAFVEEILRLASPPHVSGIRSVRDEHSIRVWRDNPGGVPASECRGSEDSILRAFAEDLPEPYLIFDLRAAKLGDGSSWGRSRRFEELRRHDTWRLFAYPPKRSLLRRLFFRT